MTIQDNDTDVAFSIRKTLHEMFGKMLTKSRDEIASASEETIAAFHKIKDDLPLKIHVLCLLGEKRGIDMSPLIVISTRWAALWRKYPDPHDAMCNFRLHLDDELLMNILGSTVERLMFKLHLEQSANWLQDNPSIDKLIKPSRPLTSQQLADLFSVHDSRTALKHANNYYRCVEKDGYYFIDLSLLLDVTLENKYLAMFPADKTNGSRPSGLVYLDRFWRWNQAPL